MNSMGTDLHFQGVRIKSAFRDRNSENTAGYRSWILSWCFIGLGKKLFPAYLVFLLYFPICCHKENISGG